MDDDQKLIMLMASAEDQQRAVWTALEGLNKEREALARERAAISQAVAAISGATAEISKSASNAVPGIRRAAGEAVEAAVAKSLAGISETTSNALMGVLGPAMGAAEASADALARASKWISWKMAALATVLIVAVTAVSWLSIEWQVHQKQSLQVDISDLQTKLYELERRGGRLVTNNCGGRLCIEVHEDPGQPWRTTGGVKLAIPKNY